MAPMTKGSNLPYRRLCVELGAAITMSEMTVARRLKQKRKGEFALIRRAPDEPFFGVQLAGTNPEEMAWVQLWSSLVVAIWSTSTSDARSTTSRARVSGPQSAGSLIVSGALWTP